MRDEWRSQVERYCSQYLQLEPELDLPDAQALRDPQVQSAIFTKVFAEDAVRYGPPPRYKLRMLKQLVSRVEGSIDNWEEHVSA